MPIKIMTIMGTRPEVIKLSRIINELDRHTDHILVHSGQNYDYELNEIFFEQLKIRKPDYFLSAAGETPIQTISDILSKSEEIMVHEKPDAFLLLGDTNSCLSAISAKRLKIPVFHMEAGNRCFDQRVPEEINRKIVDHISDINMVYSEHARRYLLSEGIRPETIIKTGSPMKEVLEYHMNDIKASKVLEDLDLAPERFFLVSAHREENIDEETQFKKFIETLNALAHAFNLPIVVSTHPRTKKRLEFLESTGLDRKIKFLKPLGFFEYVNLQMNAYCVVSDSGTITEESSILNFPAVTIRQAQERPEGMDEGTLIMCGLEPENVIDSIKVVTTQHSWKQRRFGVVEDYDLNNVSKKVLRIVLSYTHYVNRTVWFRTNP